VVLLLPGTTAATVLHGVNIKVAAVPAVAPGVHASEAVDGTLLQAASVNVHMVILTV